MRTNAIKGTNTSKRTIKHADHTRKGRTIHSGKLNGGTIIKTNLYKLCVRKQPSNDKFGPSHDLCREERKRAWVCFRSQKSDQFKSAARKKLQKPWGSEHIG